MKTNSTAPPADYVCYQLSGLVIVPRINQPAMDRLIERNPRHAQRCYRSIRKIEPQACEFRATRLLGFTAWIPVP